MEIKERDFFFALSKVIKNARKEMKLTQAEVSERSDLNKSYISDIEKGKRNPSLGVLLKLAGALELSLSVLVLRAEFYLEEGKSV